MTAERKFLLIDIVTLVICAVAVIFVQIRGIEIPQEDAAMLLRYSEHFAEGEGIVWNIGEHPVDGATDFLFMIMVGLLAKTGFTVQVAARVLTLICHFITVVAVYLFLRYWRVSRNVASLASALIIVGPARYYVAAYFGTTTFALFGLLAWGVLLTMIIEDDTRWHHIFSILCLIVGLIRPEGTFLALFMTLALIYNLGLKKAKPVLTSMLIILGLVGGSYLIWRKVYFGYFLPNPFFIKGGFEFENLTASVVRTACLTFPLIAATPILLWFKKTRSQTIILLFPVIGFTVIFAFMSNQMNFVSRFQYILLPITVVSMSLIVWTLKDEISVSISKRFASPLFSISVSSWILIFFACWYGYFFSYKFTHDSTYDVGKMLSKYNNGNYTLATTEAGLISLYSGWKSIDAYGLNDQWIAHNGGIDEGYLDRYKPQVILMHGSYRPLDDWSFQGDDPWPSMLKVLQKYAIDNNYTLAAAHGISPQSVHYYYVRNDFPESEKIITKIQNMQYFKLGEMKPSINFALLQHH